MKRNNNQPLSPWLTQGFLSMPPKCTLDFIKIKNVFYAKAHQECEKTIT